MKRRFKEEEKRVAQLKLQLAKLAQHRLGNLQCTTHNSRGAAVCPNNRTISERRATDAIIVALKEKLSQPILIESFIAGFQARLAEEEAARHDDSAKEIEKQLRTVEREIGNLFGSVAALGMSDILGAQIKQREEQRATLRTELARRTQPALSHGLPDVEKIRARFADLARTLKGGVEGARRALVDARASFVLTPDLTRTPSGWKLAGSFDVSAWIPETTNPRNLTVPGAIEKNGSGGALDAILETWVTVEGALLTGW